MAEDERNRARLAGRLAGRLGRSLRTACPYDADGSPDQRVLAAVFVRAYVAAGGTVDGLDYGGGPTPKTTTGKPSSSTSSARRGPSHGHLGYPS
jgi:hypothetical protein